MIQPSRTLQFVLMLVVALVFWWRPLKGTLRLALSTNAHTHILLIVPLSCALIYVQRKTWPRYSKASIGAGSALLIVALLIGGFSKWEVGGLLGDVRLSLGMLSLVTWWIGSVVLCFGLRTLQAFLFPLCFLFWLVPIPVVALDEIIRFLQHQSAFVARVMFLVAGVPVTQDGVVLSVPGLDVEIARECSSIRSSMMLMVTTMVLAHLFLHSWWRKAILIAVAVPLAAIKNGLRIFTIVQIATRVDPDIFDSDLHHRGGILFFAISVAMTVGVLWMLRREENAEPRGLEAAP